MQKLINGDCLESLKLIDNNSVDLVLIDPPYSSGGLFAGDRKGDTRVKYCSNDFNGSNRFPSFTGDNMDQHALLAYWSMVFRRIGDKLKPGAIFETFVDWRNLTVAIDALQCAGLVYRGIVVWNKSNSRATPYRFRNDCEYIVWGTKGPRPAPMVKGAQVFPGCYTVKSVQTRQKHHQTEKPVELLKNLVAICPEGGTVLDCFMGSGSTGVACKETGRDFIGIELAPEYFKTAQERLTE